MSMKNISISDYEKYVGYTIDNGLKMYAEGIAGIGKSTIVKSVARTRDKRVLDTRMLDVEVGDFFMRIPNHERTSYLELVNECFKSDKPMVYLFDELRHAPNDVRRMIYKPLDSGMVGNYKLPDGSAYFALSNPTDEVDTEEIERPLMDRFDIKVNVEFDFNRWKDWAYENEVRNEVIIYLEMFKDSSLNKTIDGIPVTPRTWERVSKHIDSKMYLGMLPNETGLMFKAFIDKINVFKDVDSYLEGSKKLPDELDMQYAFISAVNGKISKAKDDKYMVKWFENKVNGMYEEVKVFGNYNLIRRHQQLLGGGAFQKYWLALDGKLKDNVYSELTKLGYLQDNQV